MRKTTEDFIGTCQACFGEFKVNEDSKLIVLHGYNRPGHGSIIGQCPGTDHAPFEYDTALTVQIIATHRKEAARMVQFVRDLKAGEVATLVRSWREYDKATYREVTKTETITPESEHWDRTHRIAIANAENDATYHARMADDIQVFVTNWKRGQIVGLDVPATGLPKVLRKAYDPAEADAAEKRAAEKAARDAKPGKLSILVYRETGWPTEELSWEERQAFFTARDAETEALKGKIKAWVKANMGEGKPRVLDSSSYDLPRAVKSEVKNASVIKVMLDWSYRDQIETIFSGAICDEHMPKKRVYVVANEAIQGAW